MFRFFNDSLFFFSFFVVSTHGQLQECTGQGSDLSATLWLVWMSGWMLRLIAAPTLRRTDS